MATECIKNCCRFFVTKEKEPDPQIIKAPVPGKAVRESEWKKNVGVSEDYLLSKLPPDGKEVPFVLPSFRPSYIQPRGAAYPNYQSSAWATYIERKAELAAAGQIVYDPNVPVLPGHVISFVSPGSVRRPILRGTLGGGASAWDQNGKQRLSASMLDLSSPHSHIQRFDSVSSIQSSTSSVQDSFGSSRSLESITLSGDERELGKVCVLLSYQEAVEQVWITVVQCKDLCVCAEGPEQQRVGIKGVITMARPVQFKTSVKDATPDMVFMETFVFSLSLEQLRSSALLLRLQTHTPRKRTLGECVLSLRALRPQETQHWLDIRPPCKPRVCHAELQLATCFQPVSSRIQLQILSAQNLPSSSSLLTQSFFVKVEMFSDGRFILKRKTKVVRSSGGQVQWGESVLLPITNQDHNLQLSVKLYSRGSIRRKHLLGQVLLGFESPSPEAMEQWKDSISHPEKIVTAWHRVRHS
ncbi:tandem C2 domains nuclear protein [Colossoma macropomum]|uniref:tandem C2 domains nuclear protein n=1 Tax=Colossoma macropomum TaxID=42526 RepID=UPI001864C817|nr:tandem C2 domains nuclear protein [Colossoma macropomum]